MSLSQHILENKFIEKIFEDLIFITTKLLQALLIRTCLRQNL